MTPACAHTALGRWTRSCANKSAGFSMITIAEEFDFCSTRANATDVEVIRFVHKIPNDINRLCKLHQICAGNRSREYRPGENASGPPGGSGGAQPHPHNPRKQRKNPTAAGWGERFREGKWRTERDSNPRDGSPPTHFPGVRLRPLGQLSVGR